MSGCFVIFVVFAQCTLCRASTGRSSCWRRPQMVHTAASPQQSKPVSCSNAPHLQSAHPVTYPCRVISRGGLWRLLGTVTLNKSGRMLTEAVTSSPPLLSPHAAREDRSEIPIEIKVSALNRGLEFWWWLMSDDVRFHLFCSFLPLENQPRKNDQRSARNPLYRLCAELRAAAMKSWKRFLTFKYRPSSRLSHRFPLPTVQSVQIRRLTATCTKNQFSKKLGSKPITTKLTPSANVSNSIDHLALWH